MEYIFTNLPQYIRVTPRSEFSSSVVHSGSVLLFSENGSSLTAKLPDGSFVNVGGSGGTDVSDTTATAATVLAGYDFYNSSGVKTSGSIQTVTASLSANVTTVPAGYIAASQTLTVPLASSATVSGGIVTIPAGYVASDYTVSAGSSQAENVSMGAYISNGSSVSVGSGWEYDNPTINIYASMTVTDGGVVINPTCQGHGRLYVSSGGVIKGGYLYAYTSVYVSSGGTALYPNLNANDEYLIVFDGGIVSAAVVHSGIFRVSSGGTALDTVVIGGVMRVITGGYASGVKGNGDGKVDMWGGTAVDVSCGFRTSSGGGLISKVYLASGQSGYVNSGCTAVDVNVYDGKLYVNNSSTAPLSNVDVHSGGTITIYSNGSADNVHVYSSGSAEIWTGALCTNLVADEGAIITYI